MSKILVVDDEVGIRKICYDLFTKEGHEVITVPRGDQVLSMLRLEKPDLVLMDINVPGEEGLSLLNRMPREKGKRVPVVVFSGFVNQEVEKQAFEAGAIEVFQKGIDLGVLRDKVNKILVAKHRIFRDEKDIGKGKEKILIVDDEEAVRNLLKTFFIRKGFKTLTANSGEEALLLVEKERPAMILLDINMPGMDGLLTLKKIREIDPNVGVVMATGLHDEQIAKEATELGIYAYVLKPFDMAYLEMVVLTRLVMAA